MLHLPLSPLRQHLANYLAHSFRKVTLSVPLSTLHKQCRKASVSKHPVESFVDPLLLYRNPMFRTQFWQTDATIPTRSGNRKPSIVNLEFNTSWMPFSPAMTLGHLLDTTPRIDPNMSLHAIARNDQDDSPYIFYSQEQIDIRMIQLLCDYGLTDKGSDRASDQRSEQGSEHSSSIPSFKLDWPDIHRWQTLMLSHSDDSIRHLIGTMHAMMPRFRMLVHATPVRLREWSEWVNRSPEGLLMDYSPHWMTHCKRSDPFSDTEPSIRLEFVKDYRGYEQLDRPLLYLNYFAKSAYAAVYHEAMSGLYGDDGEFDTNQWTAHGDQNYKDELPLHALLHSKPKWIIRGLRERDSSENYTFSCGPGVSAEELVVIYESMRHFGLSASWLYAPTS